MSQGNSLSFGVEVVSASKKLSSPTGQNLANATTRTLAPSMGALAYDSGVNKLYYGSIDAWNIAGATGTTGLGATGMTGLGATGHTGMGATGNTGQPGLVSVGPFSTGTNPNAASISSQVLTLYSADPTNPGAVNTTGQTFSGTKTFNDGIIVQPSVTVGVGNIFNEYCGKTYSMQAWTGAFSVSQNLAVLRFDKTAMIAPGYTVSTLGGPGGIGTFSQILPVEFRPGTAGRGGQCPVIDNGTVKTGYFLVSTAGVITVGAGVDGSSPPTLVGFTAGGGNTGILDCVMTYSLF